MVDLAHTRTGSGPPLVLVHGLGARREMWEPLVPALAARHEVVAVDMPGFGESPPLTGPEPPSPDTLAAALAAWLAGAGLDRPHVVGNSLGGWVALELACAGVASAVTAISPGGFANERENAFSHRSLRFARAATRLLRPALPALTSTAAGRTALAAQYFAKPWRVPAPAMLAIMRGYADAPAFGAALREIVPHGFRGEVPPGVPVTIAWGTRDWLLIPRQARRAARAVPAARVVELPGCGHVPCWDDPELVTGTILATAA
jgi:pimeloyl-ACP methyl ester carboxylesterase